MTNYSLTIELDANSVQKINGAGQYLTIVKQVPGSKPVAWLTFAPAEFNTVKWTELYSVYASSTNIQEGAQITSQSSTPANGGATYTFHNNVFTQTSKIGLSPATYGVINKDTAMTINGVPEATCGLYAGAVVNGANKKGPLSATIVMFNETAHFTPIEKIRVFLSSYSDNGYVITEVLSDACEVDYTTNTDAGIVFDGTSNTFTAKQGA